MKKILIITPARVRESDLIETIRRVGCEVTLAPKTALPALDASGFDAVVISGGTESEPMTFTPAEREAADRLSRSGVRVFAEFCQYLGAVNCPNVESTRYARPVSRFRYGEIIEGDILDEQCNTRVVHFYASESRIPLLSYRANPEGFYTLKNYADAEFPVSADALWTEHDTLLFCTFRLADFAKACFAPRKKWFSLIGFILLWLTGEKHDLSFLDAYYAQNAYSTTPCEGTDVELARAAERAMDWHEKGGFLLPPDENGCRAVLEGVGAAVLPTACTARCTTTPPSPPARRRWPTTSNRSTPATTMRAASATSCSRPAGGTSPTRRTETRRLGPQRRQRVVERLLSGRRRARPALPAAAARAVRRSAARRGRGPPQSGLPAAHHRNGRAARGAHRAG